MSRSGCRLEFNNAVALYVIDTSLTVRTACPHDVITDTEVHEVHYV